MQVHQADQIERSDFNRLLDDDDEGDPRALERADPGSTGNGRSTDLSPLEQAAW